MPTPASVIVDDLQQDEVVEVARWQKLAEQVLVDEGVTGPAELSVRFVDEDTIASLNGTYMGAEGSTDVLSFPIDGDDLPGDAMIDIGSNSSGTAPRLLGDIVVCPAVAARNAPDHTGTFEDEVALLVVHGVLHVLGYDHAELDEAEAMRTREAELLVRHHGPVAVGTELPPVDGEMPQTSADPDHR